MHRPRCLCLALISEEVPFCTILVSIRFFLPLIVCLSDFSRKNSDLLLRILYLKVFFYAGTHQNSYIYMVSLTRKPCVLTVTMKNPCKSKWNCMARNLIQADTFINLSDGLLSLFYERKCFSGISIKFVHFAF